jgi:hypothetical protein
MISVKLQQVPLKTRIDKHLHAIQHLHPNTQAHELRILFGLSQEQAEGRVKLGVPVAKPTVALSATTPRPSGCGVSAAIADANNSPQ